MFITVLSIKKVSREYQGVRVLDLRISTGTVFSFSQLPEAHGLMDANKTMVKLLSPYNNCIQLTPQSSTADACRSATYTNRRNSR